MAGAASAVVLAGALAGCSVSRDEEPEPQGSSEPTEVDEPTEEPSESPTPSAEPTPSASPTTTTTAAPEPQSALLTAAEMPQLNDSSPWTEGRTTIPGADPFGLCQQFDLVTIGAMGAVERPFTSRTSGTAPKDTAGQVVAEFPDAQNAVRASKVIQAWHRKCRSQLKGATNINVRPIKDVSVASGTGWWYLVSFDRGGVGHFHSLGMVLSGTRMSLVRMDHDGQDHNYEPGQDPVELAVKAVSARLG